MTCSQCFDAGWVIEAKVDKTPTTLELIPCIIPDCQFSGREVAVLCLYGEWEKPILHPRTGAIMSVSKTATTRWRNHLPPVPPQPAQVCRVHGDPDDMLGCPFNKCQLGRVPQWSGYGMPAGTRACTVCDGTGHMTRQQRAATWLPPDQTFRPFCICRSLQS